MKHLRPENTHIDTEEEKREMAAAVGAAARS
jgi:hypothetical protein